MNSLDLVECTLNEILEAIKPAREDWMIRRTVIREIKDVVKSVECLRDATVEPFGSFVSNLFTRGGDLDISIELPNGSYISPAAKKRKQNLLGELQFMLRQRGGYRRLQFIPNARVPIVKFVSGHHGISCDISIDNLQGQMKSKFLLWINKIDGRFRKMVLLVKEWAKANGINDPKAGTINSYSLSLLVIFHFQTCVPAILPPLKDIYPGNVADDLRGVRADAERYIQQVCSSNIAKFKSDKSRKINRSSLSELFVSFILEFSDLTRKALEQGICPFTGKWEPIASTMRWLPKTSAIFIEDPFQQPENTARAVSLKQLDKISEAFETTRDMLLSENQTKSSLLAKLTRGRRNLATSSQGSRAAYAPSLMPHQHRNARPSTSQVSHQFQKRYSPLPSPRQHQYQNMRRSSLPVQHQIVHLRLDDDPYHSTTERSMQQHRRSVQQMYKPKSDK